jgi:Cu+-exporting ATPase
MMQELTLNLGGVTCGGCAGRVQKALEAVEGVSGAVVSADRTEVAVRGDRLEKPALVAAITAAGYQVLDKKTIAFG